MRWRTVALLVVILFLCAGRATHVAAQAVPRLIADNRTPYYIYGGGFIYPHYGIRSGYVHGPYRGGAYVNRGAYVGHAPTVAAPHAYSGGGMRGGFHGGGGRR